jgi:hypothetical protein
MSNVATRTHVPLANGNCSLIPGGLVQNARDPDAKVKPLSATILPWIALRSTFGWIVAHKPNDALSFASWYDDVSTSPSLQH